MSLNPMITLFEQVNHLLGHFCRATDYDPTGHVTDHLEELTVMIETGATCWEVHGMIDLYAGNAPGYPDEVFNDFKDEFYHVEQ